MVDSADMTTLREEQMMKIAFSHLSQHDSVDAVNTPRYCCDCGTVIPQQRVQAVPHCVRCISCQEKKEK